VCFASVPGCTTKVLYTAVGVLINSSPVTSSDSFTLSSARLNKPQGLDVRLRHRLARSPRSNWSPESAEASLLFKAPREDDSRFLAELDCS
jgi:hypothetical protein